MTENAIIVSSDNSILYEQFIYMPWLLLNKNKP
jgi:hypothetical protein